MPSQRVGMKSYAWIVWLAGCWLANGSLSVAWADDALSTESSAEIQSLIEQLGDDSYATREAASDKMLKFGLPALPLVEASAKNPDREIRYRCERVLAVLRDLDLQQRLEAFAADSKGTKDYGLPGWSRFVDLHGNSAQSRELFVAMFRAEPELLKLFVGNQGRLSDLMAARGFQLQQSMQMQQAVSLGSIAAMLFLGGEKALAMSDQTQQMIYSLCYQQSLRDGATNGANREVLRSLLAKYVSRGEGFIAYQGLSLAMNYDLPEGLELGRKLVKSRGGGQPHLLQMALPAMAKLGNMEDVKEVAELLDDKTVVMNVQINNQRVECQVRDLALVTALHLLAKEKDVLKGTNFEAGDIKAFGFDRLETNPTQVYSAHTVGFSTDEKRQEVFKKWEELKAKLPDWNKKQSSKQ